MDFESAHLTLYTTNDKGEKIQSVYVVTSADVSDQLPDGQMRVWLTTYLFREGKIDHGGHPPKKQPALDKKTPLISQSEKLLLINKEKSMEWATNLDIE